MSVVVVVWQFKAIEFRMSNRGEPLSQMLHCLYIYPQTLTLNKKRNLFVRVELRKDDFDIRKPPLEVDYYLNQFSSINLVRNEDRRLLLHKYGIQGIRLNNSFHNRTSQSYCLCYSTDAIFLLRYYIRLLN